MHACHGAIVGTDTATTQRDELNVTGWPRGRSRDGGIDEVPLDGAAGRLWLCGKMVVGPDPIAAMSRVDATSILCLCEAPELEERFPDYVSWLRGDDSGSAGWFPTPDLGVRPLDEFRKVVERTNEELVGGARLIVHCGAGIGRAGTFAAALLVMQGLGVEAALELVAASRPMAGPEAGAQRELIDRLAAG